MTSHPASTDHAAPDWVCILRGKFRDPKSTGMAKADANRKARDKAKRHEMRAGGYLTLKEWANARGMLHDTAYKQIQAGKIPHVKAAGQYWIRPEVEA